jgi:hypothetical protein
MALPREPAIAGMTVGRTWPCFEVSSPSAGNTCACTAGRPVQCDCFTENVLGLAGSARPCLGRCDADPGVCASRADRRTSAGRTGAMLGHRSRRHANRARPTLTSSSTPRCCRARPAASAAFSAGNAHPDDPELRDHRSDEQQGLDRRADLRSDKTVVPAARPQRRHTKWRSARPRLAVWSHGRFVKPPGAGATIRPTARPVRR